MSLPERLKNAVIVTIERPVRGFGGDVVSTTVLLENEPASRQQRTALRLAGGERQEEADTDWFLDLPADPFVFRVGDKLTWRPTGSKAIYAGAEVREVAVNDFGLKRDHLRLATRGGDGTGA